MTRLSASIAARLDALLQTPPPKVSTAWTAYFAPTLALLLGEVGVSPPPA